MVLSQHPSGELAILTLRWQGRYSRVRYDAPPDVVEKYAPDEIIGVVCSGKAKKAK